MYKLTKTSTLNILKMAVSITIFVVLLIFSLPAISDHDSINALNRLVDIDRVVAEEKGDRLQIYERHLLEMDNIWGSGPGSLMHIRGKDDTNVAVAESYLLQILVEFGFVYFIIFITSMLFILIFASRKNIKTIKVLLLAIFASMIVVHAFNNPVFFIFWGVIMYAYSTIVKPLKKSEIQNLNNCHGEVI